MKRYLLLKFIILASILLHTSTMASPAPFGLSIESQVDEVMLGQPIEVRLLLSNPKHYDFNAISATIVIPKDYFLIEEFWFGDSFVPLWLSEPDIKETDSTQVVVFEGLIPGGYSDSGEVVRLVLRTQDTIGSTSVRLADASIFLHNKHGTRVDVPTDYNFISILPLGADLPQVLAVTEDRVPPDNFFPIVAKNEEMFDGEYFLIFQTVDRQSGIQRYELLESTKFYSEQELVENKQLAWREINNPGRLIDQDLESYLYIRAIDRHNNQRTVIIPPTVFSGTSERSFILKSGGLAVALLGLAVFLVRRRYRFVQEDEESIS